MKSAKRGRATSTVEVTNVSPHGFWLLVGGDEKLVPFEKFPWFREATIADLSEVVLQAPGHLHWPSLDIDLALDSLDHPEKYPLVSRVAERSSAAAQYAATSRRASRKAASKSQRAR